MKRFKRELKWLGWGFGLPFILILCVDLSTGRSDATPWQRLRYMEDFCAYGSCIVLPFLTYTATLLGRGAWFILKRYLLV
jgi:hypothetical protein